MYRFGIRTVVKQSLYSLADLAPITWPGGIYPSRTFAFTTTTLDWQAFSPTTTAFGDVPATALYHTESILTTIEASSVQHITSFEPAIRPLAMWKIGAPCADPVVATKLDKLYTENDWLELPDLDEFVALCEGQVKHQYKHLDFDDLKELTERIALLTFWHLLRSARPERLRDWQKRKQTKSPFLNRAYLFVRHNRPPVLLCTQLNL